MPFPYDPEDLAAIDRLANFYNGGDYDASTNPGGMGRGGHRVNFENALADAARVGAGNSAAAVAAGSSATSAGDSAAAAALSAAKLIGSSSSSVAIAAGSKAFVTQAGKFFAVGTFVLIYSAANPTANYMAGQVSAYSGTDLTVDVTVTKGSGTFTDWVISVASAPGATGDDGVQGPVGPTPDIMVTFSDGVTDADPGNGLIKFNNAAPASTTQLFIDNLDRYGTSIANWLDSFDDSTNTALRGTVKLVQVSDPQKYARFDVVGAVVDGTGYRKIPVTHVLSRGTFTNGAILAIDFVRTGNKGLDGDGAGDVLGPATSTDGHVALFDGTTGKLLKSGGALAAVANSGEASDVIYAPAGIITATNVQDAIAFLGERLPTVSRAISGLVLFNDAVNPNTHIGLTAGGARDRDGLVDIVLPSAMIKRLDANWAAGSGNGGLDTGTVAAYTGYHHFIIRNPTTSAVDSLLSTSALSPVMPSGFTQRRRVGALITGASGYIHAGVWHPNGDFAFAKPLAHGGGAGSASAVSLFTTFVPSGVKMKALYTILARDPVAGDTGFSVVFRDPDLGAVSGFTDAEKKGATAFSKPAGALAIYPVESWTDTAARVYMGGFFGRASSELEPYITGWHDSRGE